MVFPSAQSGTLVSPLQSDRRTKVNASPQTYLNRALLCVVFRKKRGASAAGARFAAPSSIQLLSSSKPDSCGEGALLPARKSTKVRCINVADYRIRVFSIQSVYRLDAERPQVASNGEFPLEG